MKAIKKLNENKKERWIRPWNTTKFDNLFNRDDRFFAILTKGILSWLNNHIVMYDKPINHFIFNTGSSYLYLEPSAIDYEYKIGEVTGESAMYSAMPRCVIEFGGITVDPGDLSSGFSRGSYERLSHDKELNLDVIKSYNASIKRIPIELSLSLKYVLSNFNESIILAQEYIDKLIFQKYFNIVYLGNIIQCSIELPQNFQININKIDMAATETIQKTIEIELKIKTSYPCVNERTEIGTDKVIAIFNNRIILSGDENSDLNDSIGVTTDDPIDDVDNNVIIPIPDTGDTDSDDPDSDWPGNNPGDHIPDNSDTGDNGSNTDNPTYNDDHAIIINTEYTHYLELYPNTKLIKKGVELYIQITPNEYRYVGTTSLTDEEWEQIKIIDANKYPNISQDVQDYIIS